MPWSQGKARHARLLVVGEAPGAEEDRQGEPFVGPAGKLGRKMLKDAGIDPWVTAFANVVSCYPHGPPPEVSVRACNKNLWDQIDAVRPDYILCFGVVALHAISEQDLTMGEAHGWWWRRGMGTDEMWCTATYHPSAILRGGTYTQEVTVDLLGLASVMNRNATPARGNACVKCGRGIYMWRGDWPYCGRHFWSKSEIAVTQRELL